MSWFIFKLLKCVDKALFSHFLSLASALLFEMPFIMCHKHAKKIIKEIRFMFLPYWVAAPTTWTVGGLIPFLDWSHVSVLRETVNGPLKQLILIKPLKHIHTLMTGHFHAIVSEQVAE